MLWKKYIAQNLIIEQFSTTKLPQTYTSSEVSCFNLSLLSMLFRIDFRVYIYIQETIILNFIKS